jgi:hypothetical protein
MLRRGRFIPGNDADLIGCRNLAPPHTGFRSPVRAACSELLYRLSYPGTQLRIILSQNTTHPAHCNALCICCVLRDQTCRMTFRPINSSLHATRTARRHVLSFVFRPVMLTNLYTSHSSATPNIAHHILICTLRFSSHRCFGLLSCLVH